MEKLECAIDDLGIAKIIQGKGASQNDHNDPPCNRCHKIATKKCANCETIEYCSREFQRQDWKEHKKGLWMWQQEVGMKTRCLCKQVASFAS